MPLILQKAGDRSKGASPLAPANDLEKLLGYVTRATRTRWPGHERAAIRNRHETFKT